MFFLKLLKALFPDLWRRFLEVKELEAAQHAQLQILANRLRQVRLIHPDEQGLYPLVLVGNNILDPNRGITMDGTTGLVYMDDRVYTDEVKRRVLQAIGSLPSRAADEVVQAEYEALSPGWPAKVNIAEICESPSLDNLVIGIKQDGTLVTSPLGKMMHTLVIGASGWGKSVFLQAFLWQLANAPEPVQVIAIDLSGSAFNVLHNWKRLRYPVVKDDPGVVVAVLQEVLKELERRKELYNQYPLAGSLPEYNDIAKEPLEPWVIVVDEGTTLLGQNGIGDILQIVVMSARQYGIYTFVAGQTARYDIVPPPMRDQYSTRVCFQTTGTSSRVVLDDPSAASLRVKGRMLVQIPGETLVQLQGLYVDRRQLLAAANKNNGKEHQLALPAPIKVGKKAKRPRWTDEQQDQVIDLATNTDESDTAIARKVFGHGTMPYIDKVRAIKSEVGL